MRQPQDAQSKFQLSKHGLYLKFILLLSGVTNLNRGPTISAKNDRVWKLIPFRKCSFSTDWMDF